MSSRDHRYGEILPPGCPNLYYEVSMKINRYLFAAKYVVGKMVLDVGCATGYGAALLKEKGAERVVGADSSCRALKVATTRYSRTGLGFLYLDAQRLPLPDESFDGIVAFEIIEHLPQYQSFVSECRRVLKKEGVFLCSTPNKAVVSPNGQDTYRSHHFHEFYSDEFANLLSKHFGQVALFGCVPFVAKEKTRDDLLYNLALRVAPHLPVRGLVALSGVINLVTWIPPLREYRLIRVEETADWDSFHRTKFEPYPLGPDAPMPLGLIAVAKAE